MIRGKDKPFVAGKSFTFYADMTKEEKRRDRSKTRRCLGCLTQRPKTHFSMDHEWCIKCEDKE